MLAKEKHFTKCETPNSSKMIEDKKYISNNKLANGIVTNETKTNNNKTTATIMTTQNETKEVKMDENKVTSTTAEIKPVNGSVTDEKPDCDDSNGLYNAPKYGTVIPNRIFVGGFSAKTADEDLWRFFSSFCHITAAKIIYDRAGVSKCYGFVTFANPKDAKNIVKQHGGVMHSPMGRLRIAQAVRKQPPPPPLPPTQPGMPLSAPGHFPMEQLESVQHHQPAAHYYHHKGTPICIPLTSYIPITQGPMGKYPPAPPTQSASPHDSHSVTPESPHMPPSNMGTPQMGKMLAGGCVRYAPPAPPPPATATVLQQTQQRPPSVPSASLYAPQGGMIPQYVIPAVAYPQSLPAYDATGLYTTCPGYATYPSYVMMAPPPQPPYHHTATAAAPPHHHHHHMLPPPAYAHTPIINSYIY